MKLTNLLIGSLTISLCSCVVRPSLSGETVIETRYKPYPAMPVEPTWKQFTRQPVIKKDGNDFVVSDEFVTKAAQEHDYIKRVNEWKKVNSIP